jgi:carbon monoxide dehydrogenase subunit G
MLAGCIPGCQEFNETAPDTYEVRLRVGIGAVSGTYQGIVKLTDSVEPSSFRLIVEGKGRTGDMRGEGLLTLAAMDEGTLLEVSGEAHVTGLFARLGQRLMGSAANTMMNQFFNCLKSRVEAGREEDVDHVRGG